MQYRPHRLAQELKTEISAIITREMPHHHFGFLTITEVKVSPDLRYARVFVSVFGPPEEQQKSLDLLNNEKGFVRQLISKRFRLRQAPEISFVYDETIENGDRMLRLIDEVKKELPEEDARPGN
ncbi:MAG: 30S ribosome-binding factor RbfA [Blastocatellia bacterium]